METPTARPVLLHPARCGKAARSETRCGGQTPSTGLNGFWSQHCMNKKCRSYDGGGGARPGLAFISVVVFRAFP